MTDFSSFLEEQERIYGTFRSASEQVRIEGAVADPVFTSRKGGIFIAFRHPPEIAHAIGELSRQIAERVPAVLYAPESIHTTISDYGVADGRVVPQDDGVLNAISSIVSLRRLEIGEYNVELGEVLVNHTSVIIAGTPDAAFLKAAELIQRACQDQGISLRLPWGGHVTVSRFKEPFPAEKAASLLDFVARTPPIGKCNLVAIDVGTFHYTQDQFVVETHTHIPLG